MKRRTRRNIFNTLFTAISNWLEEADKATNNWKKPISKWPYLRTGVYSYDKPKTQKAAEAGPKLKSVDVVRVATDGTTAKIMFRKENLCLASFIWDANKKAYVLVIASALDTADKLLRPKHKTWFLFFLARRALIHALTQRGIKAGGYKKISTEPDNVEINYAGLHTVFGGVASNQPPKTTWLRFLKVRAIVNKIACTFIKDTEKRKLVTSRVENFIKTMQNIIATNE